MKPDKGQQEISLEDVIKDTNQLAEKAFHSLGDHIAKLKTFAQETAGLMQQANKQPHLTYGVVFQGDPLSLDKPIGCIFNLKHSGENDAKCLALIKIRRGSSSNQVEVDKNGEFVAMDKVELAKYAASKLQEQLKA